MADLFNPFCRTLDTMPVQGILLVLERQRQMLEDDIAQKRTMPISDVRSILNFCRFITASRQNESLPAAVLPFPHLIFYRKTVARLVEANILPENAATQFDEIFSAGFQRRPNTSNVQYNRSMACNY
jgi:hypothetical protein